MSNYRVLFFDLDHTLWDFATNAGETLGELFDVFELQSLGIPSAAIFMERYTVINDQMWADYRANRIDKAALRSGRFEKTLSSFAIEAPELADQIGTYYIEHSPRKTHLFPHTHTTLDYLAANYELHLITNGFEEVQHVKITESKLAPYFSKMITSERAGVKKPDKGIFLHAMKETGAKRKESLMIGDNLEADIAGARRIGMDQVFFNPHKQAHGERPTFEIDCLSQLRNFL